MDQEQSSSVESSLSSLSSLSSEPNSSNGGYVIEPCIEPDEEENSRIGSTSHISSLSSLTQHSLPSVRVQSAHVQVHNPPNNPSEGSSNNTILYVPDHQVTISAAHLPRNLLEDPSCAHIVIGYEIPQATSIKASEMEKYFMKRCPKTLFRRWLTFVLATCLFLSIGLWLTLHFRDDPPTIQKEDVNSTSSRPTHVSTFPPSFSPVAWSWENETIINIDVERPDLNDLMGYSVSISNDGNTLAVGGYKTFHIYAKIKQGNDIDDSWQKVFDSTDLVKKEDELKDLSWRTVVSLSSDGHYVVIGNYLADVTTLENGVVMVFSNLRNGNITQWYQVGSSILGSKAREKFGVYVAIADSGKRIAAATLLGGGGYVKIFDFDGSEWMEVMVKDNNAHSRSGSIALSPDGNLLALQNYYHRVVVIYELTTFTDQYVLLEDGIHDFGSSMSFSGDSSTFALSSASSNQVFLYQFNQEEQRYIPSGPPINVSNVTGFGHSISISDDGKYIAVGAVCPPTENFHEKGDKFNDNYVYFFDRISKYGKVFIFRLKHGGWEQIAAFEHDMDQYDKIGWSVSLSGDGSAIAIGGYGTGSQYGDGSPKNGQVSIYKREEIV